MERSQREKTLRAFLLPRPGAGVYAAAGLLALTLAFMFWILPQRAGIIYALLLIGTIRVLARAAARLVRFRRGWRAAASDGAAETLAGEYDAAEPEADGAVRFGAEHLFVRAGGMPPRYDDVARVFRKERKSRPRGPLLAQLRDGSTIRLARLTADADGDALAARLTDRLLQREPDIETHPAEQPPIFDAKEFDL